MSKRSSGLFSGFSFALADKLVAPLRAGDVRPRVCGGTEPPQPPSFAIAVPPPTVARLASPASAFGPALEMRAIDAFRQQPPPGFDWSLSNLVMPTAGLLEDTLSCLPAAL